MAGSASVGLERADLELEPVAEALDPSQNPHGVALAEPRVEEVDVVPDPALDAAAPVDELEHEVGGALPCVRRCLRETAYVPSTTRSAVELRDGAHGLSLGRW